MTVEHVYSTLDKIARTTGTGSQELKIRDISSLLSDSSPREARYIMKFVMGTLQTWHSRLHCFGCTSSSLYKR